MTVYGPFSQEAHKIEQDNIRMKQEIEMLKNELSKQSNFFQDKVNELQFAKSKYQELMAKVESMEKYQSMLNCNIQELERQNQMLKDQCEFQKIEHEKLEKQAKQCCCCCSCASKKPEPKNYSRNYQTRYQKTNSSAFTSKILKIASDALNIDLSDAIGSYSEKQQERIALKLIRKLAAQNGVDDDEDDDLEYQHEKFNRLKKKYQNKTKKCRELHDECEEYIEERKTKRKYATAAAKTKRTSSVKTCKKQCLPNVRKLHEITKNLKGDYEILADIDRMQKVLLK